MGIETKKPFHRRRMAIFCNDTIVDCEKLAILIRSKSDYNYKNILHSSTLTGKKFSICHTVRPTVRKRNFCQKKKKQRKMWQTNSTICIIVKLNVSTTATLMTEESGSCREVTIVGGGEGGVISHMTTAIFGSTRFFKKC